MSESFFTLKFEKNDNQLKLVSNSKHVGTIEVNNDRAVCQRKLLKVWLQKNLKHKYSPNLNSWQALEKKINEAGYSLRHVHSDEERLHIYVIFREK